MCVVCVRYVADAEVEEVRFTAAVVCVVCVRYVADAEVEEVRLTAAVVTQRSRRPTTDVSV